AFGRPMVRSSVRGGCSTSSSTGTGRYRSNRRTRGVVRVASPRRARDPGRMTVRSEPDLPREFDAVVPNALTVRLRVDLPIAQAPLAGRRGGDAREGVARRG